MFDKIQRIKFELKLCFVETYQDILFKQFKKLFERIHYFLQFYYFEFLIAII